MNHQRECLRAAGKRRLRGGLYNNSKVVGEIEAKDCDTNISDGAEAMNARLALGFVRGGVDEQHGA